VYQVEFLGTLIKNLGPHDKRVLISQRTQL